VNRICSHDPVCGVSAGLLARGDKGGDAGVAGATGIEDADDDSAALLVLRSVVGDSGGGGLPGVGGGSAVGGRVAAAALLLVTFGRTARGDTGGDEATGARVGGAGLTAFGDNGGEETTGELFAAALIGEALTTDRTVKSGADGTGLGSN
jgi:hypothetical protein